MSDRAFPTSNPNDDALFLQVLGAGEPRCILLEAGMSIGSDPRNRIRIDDPDAQLVHALIERHGNHMLLVCAGDATVLLADGTHASRLMMAEGVSCRIGSAVLTCTNAQSPWDIVIDGRCPRCTFYLDLLPESRRFCPRCGLNLSKDLGPCVVEHPLPVVEYHAPQPVVPLAAVADDEPFHSLMIQGYATAMNKLGVRYEAGQGVPRNEDEAIRCYGKAARLGNEDARSRLERQQPL